MERERIRNLQAIMFGVVGIPLQYILEKKEFNMKWPALLNLRTLTILENVFSQ